MLAIGNGESRKFLDLSQIKRDKIACNAAYRDLKVDHLVCVDRRTLDEAVFTHDRIYTRTQWLSRYKDHSNVFPVPRLPYSGIQRWDDAWHWGSGPYAVLLAAQLTTVNRVDVVGFDLYSKDNRVNNVYKGTKNYAAETKAAVDPRYWIYQIGKIFELYPHCEFRIHQPVEWQLPDLWKKSNVEVDTLSILSYIK